jgi:uncharacterized membrane protein YphA (DoxX/SURF4 family)
MSDLIWDSQLLLAGVFLLVGLSGILAVSRRTNMPATRHGVEPSGLSAQATVAVAILEMAGAVALVLPVNSRPPYLLAQLAAAALALLTVVAIIRQLRRHQSAAPGMALFLLALSVVVGRLP